jgi:hypothetical protein
MEKLCQGEGLIWLRPFWDRFIHRILSSGQQDFFSPDEKHVAKLDNIGQVTAVVSRARFLSSDFLRVIIDIE